MTHHPLINGQISGDNKTLCINFIGKSVNKNYGFVYDKETKHHVLLHRYLYKQLVGHLTPHQVVMHLCNRPKCINPDHLKAGTQRENVSMANMFRAVGELNGRATLKTQDVIEIRKRSLDGEVSPVIAKSYGVTEGHIRQIISREYWSHI